MVKSGGRATADGFLATRVEAAVGRGGRKLAAAGIKTAEDLLRHYPKRYEDPRTPTDMASLRLDEVATIYAEVVSAQMAPTRNQRQWRVVAKITDGRYRLDLTFFLNKPYLVDYYLREYRAGRMGLFTGRVSMYKGTMQLVHPEVIWAEQFEQLDPRFKGRLIPIYPAVGGLQSPQLQRAIQAALTALGGDAPTDPVPAAVLSARHLPGLGRAWWDIHNPQNESAWRAALRRFRFEEAFVLQTALARRRIGLENQGGAKAWPLAAGSLVETLDAALPFELTADQLKAGQKISSLLAQTRPMNQLLQGDVGSGKTVVALRAMLQVVAGSGQAVLLAPTEVLAGQHHQTIAKLLEAAELRDRIGLELLTGSVAGKAKTELLAKVAEGGAGLVVGTHALLEGSVEFHDLGLVVVDEQHRFGVEQRDVLRTRGEVRPHVLVMTATPIPRTVAMTVFGDLEATTLEASPPGRQPVPTTWVNPVSHPGWLKRVWERVAEEARSGHGAFVICPTIEGSQTEDGAELWEDQAPAVMAFGGPASPGGRPNGGAGSGGAKRPLASVKATLEQLRNEPALAGLRLEALHGRMAPAEKDRVMGEFAAGQIDVLVATTVVEVGIDVPRATALVVLDADRFGLSQLHQLRGRVGRGEAQGVCLLVSTAEEGTPAATRLAAMERISSGFELANVDLLTRREGQVLGESQSGASSLRLVRLAHDADLILDARDAATALVRQDPDLVDHGALARAVERLLAGREDYLERG